MATGRRPDPVLHQLWHQRLQRFRHSGLRVAEFCDRERISVASFYAWRRRLHDAAPAGTTPGFVPVRVVSSANHAPVELVLPSGFVLRLNSDTDLNWLRQLLALLQEPSC
jgi:hypothetical protein